MRECDEDFDDYRSISEREQGEADYRANTLAKSSVAEMLEVNVTTCTRCESSGFLNLHQVDEQTLKTFDATGDLNIIQKWIESQTQPHDVQVCDCCGDGAGWYGVPGEHYGPDDPQGERGPYANNGGLCQCH